ncbi:MAG: hypothetical protein SW019_06330 [Actinomycetota bacterium]|nr:hypothetical protein [Actinomycetota bacterium]
MTRPSKRSRIAVNTVFGETLPEASSDEREPAAPEDREDHERWLRDNVPPHHD